MIHSVKHIALMLSILLLVGCTAVDDFDDYPMTAADCFDDEIYDSADQMCYLAMTPDDCFDDETYDELDQTCYLTCEIEGTCEANETVGVGEWLRDFTDRIAASFSFVGDDELNVLVTYTIDTNNTNRISDPIEGEAYSDDEIEILDDATNHTMMWEQFTHLIPQQNRWMLSKFGVFTDGMENTMAYVEPDPDAPEKWILTVDPADAINKNEQTYTLIHEYGHLLTLNGDQVSFNEEAYFAEDDETDEADANACSTFYTAEGCTGTQSYMNAFYAQFWAEIYPEWEAAEFDENIIYDDLYPTYEDRFLTEYASTNPGEDIAESWTHFVLYPKPASNTIADQKVRFFYDYPELLQLRREIIGRLYSNFRER